MKNTHQLFYTIIMLCLCQAIFFVAMKNILNSYETFSIDEYSSLETEKIPIMNGISRGFHPTYIYHKPIELPYKSYSQVKQDFMVHALIKAGNKNGETPFFIDLAANDALDLSNTVALELSGWDGVCIEPNPIYWYDLARLRKCTIIGAFVGGSVDGEEVNVVLDRGTGGGIVGDEMDNKKNSPFKEERRNTVSLLTVFKETNTPRVIDYFSFDVEGAESLVLEHFPWDLYKFKVMTIERPRRELREKLTANGYTFIASLSIWGETLWIREELLNLSKTKIGEIITFFCMDTEQECCGNAASFWVNPFQGLDPEVIAMIE